MHSRSSKFTFLQIFFPPHSLSSRFTLLRQGTAPTASPTSWATMKASSGCALSQRTVRKQAQASPTCFSSRRCTRVRPRFLLYRAPPQPPLHTFRPVPLSFPNPKPLISARAHPLTAEQSCVALPSPASLEECRGGRQAKASPLRCTCKPAACGVGVGTGCGDCLRNPCLRCDNNP